MALTEKTDVMQNEIEGHERRYLFCISINNNLYGDRTDGRAWVCGILICILVMLFLQPLMMAFGATEDILSYAMEYSGITSFWIPFLLFSTGTSPLVRGDGNARYSMTAFVAGAILNIILDYTFMYVFSWGLPERHELP